MRKPKRPRVRKPEPKGDDPFTLDTPEGFIKEAGEIAEDAEYRAAYGGMFPAAAYHLLIQAACMSATARGRVHEMRHLMQTILDIPVPEDPRKA